MSEQWYRRIGERDEGRRRLSRLTRWTAATGVALAAIFGVALARHDQAAAASSDQNEVTDDNGRSSGLPGSDGGSVVQPPTSAGGRSHAHSGGS
jgi:hypothetical protein